MSSGCNCPCHQGAGVIHVRPRKETTEVVKVNKGSDYSYYLNSSTNNMEMGSCPCELNKKIADLVKDYYK